MLPELTLNAIKAEASVFSRIESDHSEPSLYGITDGKAVGTYLEHKFRQHLTSRYMFETGNSAMGIDFPSLNLDIKVTSIRQPQSSCPFRSARQKIYGLGYHLLVFVYDKTDDPTQLAGRLQIKHAVFVDKERTGDYQITLGLSQLLTNGANTEEIASFLMDRSLPADEITLNELAEEIQNNPPRQGYLTISNALQWRLQYRRSIDSAGSVAGVDRVL